MFFLLRNAYRGTMNKEFCANEWGTFKDCLKAPVYRWFTYPAGFSFKAVEYSLKSEGLGKGNFVYDPFMGSGTTNLAAKTMGINSYGVEAHPFVFPITKCKMNWDIDESLILNYLQEIKGITSGLSETEKQKIEIISQEFPELVLKCFLPSTLYELLLIRNYVRTIENYDARLFLSAGLICCLRTVSIAATGWPYIAPNKIKITSLSKRGVDTYINFVKQMMDDVRKIKFLSHDNSEHKIFLGDSRNTRGIIDDSSVDHIFTSPPYLNNFDYADRTRLEMYFMGEAKSWSDICDSVRTKLITSATTQISRSDPKYAFLDEFVKCCPEEHSFLRDSVDSLSQIRKTKGGKKNYDLLVVGYFNDMFQTLKENFRVLKPGSTAKYILGDSAPYGVHIPTDELIGQIGCHVGFKGFKIDLLRARGEKWKSNPQRHGVQLRETIVTLTK